MPTWGADFSGIDFDTIYYYIKPVAQQGKTWATSLRWSHYTSSTAVCLRALGCAILTLCWGVGDETVGRKGVHAKTTHPYTHLVGPEQDVCPCYPGPSTTGDSARTPGTVGGVVDDAFLLLLPGAIRSSQCPQRVPATRSGLLVCLPHQREPNPQALSGTNRDADPGALRGGGTGSGQRA